MAMLRLAALGETPLMYQPERGTDAQPLTVEAARAVAPALRKIQPLVVMVHGYKFDPFFAHAADPHDYLYHFDPERMKIDRWRRPASWPLGLGFSENDRYGIDGLCVGFGWCSKPQLRFGRFCAAYVEAEVAGRALLRTLDVLARAFPHREIDIFTHSLGARVALIALRDAAEQGRSDLIARLGRLLLLGPAELVGTAREIMRCVDAARAARSPQIYNVMARENDVFDVMVERFAPRIGGARPICLGATGLGRDREGWLDLQLDSAALHDWLARRGVEIGGGVRRACHWGVYNRPGAMAFYSAILRDRPRWAIPALREAGIPNHLEERWARWRAPRLFAWRRDGLLAEQGEPAI